MTTVTEAGKRFGDGWDRSDLEDADLATICADPMLAQRFARQLAELAGRVIPGRRFSVEDLRDIFEAAVHGRLENGVRIVEGRYFRKRVREQCALSDRYGDPFSVVVAALKPEPEPGVYARLLDSVVERLRQTDMVFLYRRRFALVLPRMRRESLTPFTSRIGALVRDGLGDPIVESIEALVYPDERFTDTQAVLDWAEDQLRTV